MRVKAAGTGVLVAAVTLLAGCHDDRDPPPQPGVLRPRADTAHAVVGGNEYVVKVDGTLHFPHTAINLTCTASSMNSSSPPVTRLEVLITLEGAADPVARASFPTKWLAQGGQWRMDIWNAFPDPEVGTKAGRLFAAGSYLLSVVLYDGDHPVGQVGPLEVYLGFDRHRGY
jgi:hypothetical protein